MHPTCSVRIELKATSEAWKTPYIGNFHQKLLNNINKTDRTGNYSNSVPLIPESLRIEMSGTKRPAPEPATLVAMPQFERSLKL